VAISIRLDDAIFPRSNAIAPHSAYPEPLGLGLGAEIVDITD